MIPIDWKKAPEGFPIWVESHYKNDPSDWHRRDGKDYVDRRGGTWFLDQVKRGECTIHEQCNSPTWDGVGRPPAGVSCEFQHHNAPDGKWHPTTIRYSSHAFVIYVDSIHEVEECWRVNDSCAIDFRPFRTAEQIAADERLHKIRNALTAIQGVEEYNTTVDASAAIRATVEAMIDVGYRKEPTQ